MLCAYLHAVIGQICSTLVSVVGTYAVGLKGRYRQKIFSIFFYIFVDICPLKTRKKDYFPKLDRSRLIGFILKNTSCVGGASRVTYTGELITCN